MKKIVRLALCGIVILGLMGPAAASDEPAGEVSLFPEQTAYVYVYGGYGYYRWKMMSASDYLGIFGAPNVSGIRYDHDASPFIIKKYGIKSNISIFSLGMDYFSDQLKLPTEYNNKEDIEKKGDNRAEQLKLLSGLRFGDVALHFSALFRDFRSTITSRGYRGLGGITHPIYYYPKTGDMQVLSPGESISWYTIYSEYEAKIEFISKRSSFELGGKYIQFEAPTEMSLQAPGIMGDVLMYTRNTMANIFLGFRSLSSITDNLYLQYYVPVNLSGFGGYRAESRYIKTEKMKPFTFNSLSVSSSGNIALQYIRRYMKLEAGVDYGMYYSWVNLTDTRLKKDVTLIDEMDGTPTMINAGEPVDISFTRIEFFWGFYFAGSVFF